MERTKKNKDRLTWTPDPSSQESDDDGTFGDFKDSSEDTVLMSKGRSNLISQPVSNAQSSVTSNEYMNRPRSRTSTICSFLNYISEGTHSRSTLMERCTYVISSLRNLLLLELNVPKREEIKGILSKKRDTGIDNSLEEVLNMLRVPLALESFIMFGLLVGFNSLLTILTLVPVKIFLMLYKSVIESALHYKLCHTLTFKPLKENMFWIRRDIITMTTLIFAFTILSFSTLDISRMYHDVKGQADIKLYVMFGVLEVADKLCASIGQELLVMLYKAPFSTKLDSNLMRFVIILCLLALYVSIHSFILIYETVSLNVAANSYSNALLTLLLSNQFGELKGSVFKKFEREGLFQLAMSDLTERFQLSLMLGILSLRNLLQISNTQSGMAPKSWKSWNNWFGAIYGPSIVVIGSEVLVDWLKHCYIIKFNKIRPRIYKNFLFVLSLDYMDVFKAQPTGDLKYPYELTDYLLVTKRIGLPILPSIICFFKMIGSDVVLFFDIDLKLPVSLLVLFFWTTTFIVGLLFLRLLLGFSILRWANTVKTKHTYFQGLLQIKQEKRGCQDSESSSSGLSKERKKNVKKTNSYNMGISEPKSSSNSGQQEVQLETTQHEDHNSSPISPVDYSFKPGNPNTESSSINPVTRSFLYDYGEEIPPTLEERRNELVLRKASSNKTLDDDLRQVLRYKMSSKRIW